MPARKVTSHRTRFRWTVDGVSTAISLGANPPTAMKGVRADMKFNDEIESVMAQGDPLRVRQILRNLLTNAGRYGGDTVTVHVGTAGDTA